MLKVKTDIDSLEKLDKYIDFVNKMLQMQTDKDFQKFIQKKCLETIKTVSINRLVSSGGAERCTNEEYFA